MDAVCILGIWMAETLQQRMRHMEVFWVIVTSLGDAKSAFLLVFPCTFFISRRAAIGVIWVAVITEWTNLILKWIFFGDRPYWWIGESRLYEFSQPRVRQYPCTCETGPGSPSGHSMISAAVWWVLVSSISSTFRSWRQNAVISAIPYVTYIVLLTAVGISRVFVLAHFPHQVIAGCLAGYLLGSYLSKQVPDGEPPEFFYKICVALLLGTLIPYFILQLLGVDLSWSVYLAKKWCVHAEWVQRDTAPLSALMRVCGVLVGLGLAQQWKPSRRVLSWPERASTLSLSAVALFHLSRVPLPVQARSLFYVLFFLKHTLVPLIVLVFSPSITGYFSRSRRN